MLLTLSGPTDFLGLSLDKEHSISLRLRTISGHIFSVRLGKRGVLALDSSWKIEWNQSLKTLHML